MSRPGRNLTAYVLLSVLLFLFDNIYAMFGHGVRSLSMTLACPALLALALPFAFLRFFRPGAEKVRGYRLFLNIHSTGAALLVMGLLLRGVLEIAGGYSEILPWYFVLAAATLAVGFFEFALLLTRYGHKRIK
ncbi:MAG: hypothetical protein LBI44_07805 [Oscillospiraceae bacterium]|jgi:hypothetical protein|nr:hypothetical protein [Oscillospiraceae bacterium]